eukprot:9010137-Lingulodinium_polyedra.AAC.1
MEHRDGTGSADHRGVGCQHGANRPPRGSTGGSPMGGGRSRCHSGQRRRRCASLSAARAGQ